ncbi:MAG: hypothetical protein EXX96DRAFT_482821, partial [Benjaminiella poitrasii]
DNLIILLRNPSDFQQLQFHLDAYSVVSNAKFNTQNTEVVLFSGRPISTECQSILQG